VPAQAAARTVSHRRLPACGREARSLGRSLAQHACAPYSALVEVLARSSSYGISSMQA
jgi:hypothetical protein